MITLKENLTKQINLLNEINRLSEPSIYFHNTNYKPQLDYNKRCRKHLKNAVKSLKKLTKAIDKQVMNGDVINYWRKTAAGCSAKNNGA